MNKKYIIAFNSFLVVMFLLKVFLLITKFNVEKSHAENLENYKAVEIKRPSFEAMKDYRKIFGATPSDTALDEKQLDAEIITLRGVFVAQGERHAVVSIKKVKDGREEVVRTSVGDKVRELTVKSISPGHIQLEDSDSNIITLKIFSR
jgi:hypothetical protein